MEEKPTEHATQLKSYSKNNRVEHGVLHVQHLMCHRNLYSSSIIMVKKQLHEHAYGHVNLYSVYTFTRN